MEIEINTKVELDDDLAEALLAYGVEPDHGHQSALDDPRFQRLAKAGMYTIQNVGPGNRGFITEKGRMVLAALQERVKPVIEHLGCYGIMATPDAQGGLRLDSANAAKLQETLHDLQENRKPAPPPSRTPTREAPRVQPGNPVQPQKPLNYGHKPGEYPYAVGSCSVCENRSGYSRGGDGPNCPGCGQG